MRKRPMMCRISIALFLGSIVLLLSTAVVHLPDPGNFQTPRMEASCRQGGQDNDEHEREIE